MALELEISKMDVQEQDINDLSWLTTEELKTVKGTLAHMELDPDFKTIAESNMIDITYFFENGAKGIVSRLQNLKINDNTRLEITSLPDTFDEFGVKVFHVKEIDNQKFLHFVSYLDGKYITDKKEEFQGEVLENPNLLDLYNESIPDKQNGGVEAAWGGLPCVQNGCCTIREPLYPGSSPIIPIMYKWCGASCGSGTPVNSVDTCCRTHDYCYQSFKTYPSRCSCDRNIRSCVAGTGYRAASLIRTAFAAKMFSYGC